MGAGGMGFTALSSTARRGISDAVSWIHEAVIPRTQTSQHTRDTAPCRRRTCGRSRFSYFPVRSEQRDGAVGATKGSFSFEFRELSVVLTALTRPPHLPHHGGRPRPSTSTLLAMIPSPTQHSIPASPRHRQRLRP